MKSGLKWTNNKNRRRIKIRNELLFMQAYRRQPNLLNQEPDKVLANALTMNPIINWASSQPDITKEKLKTSV